MSLSCIPSSIEDDERFRETAFCRQREFQRLSSSISLRIYSRGDLVDYLQKKETRCGFPSPFIGIHFGKRFPRFLPLSFFFPTLVLRLATFARIPNMGICRRRLVALFHGALGACFSHKCSTFFLLARERPAMAASQRAPRGLRSNPKTCVSPRFCVYIMLPPLYLSPCILYYFLHCSPLSRNEPSDPETINLARSYLPLSLFLSYDFLLFFAFSTFSAKNIRILRVNTHFKRRHTAVSTNIYLFTYLIYARLISIDL